MDKKQNSEDAANDFSKLSLNNNGAAMLPHPVRG
jgi:hypothetical protein